MFEKIIRWWRWDGRYLHHDIKYGIKNLIRWFPIIWKDRDWDQAYIWDILEKKLRNQSHHIKHYGHHVNTDYDSRNMRICADLIKRIRDEYYDMEYLDYCNYSFDFIPTDKPNLNEMVSKENWEKFDDYFAKYPLIYKQVVAKTDKTDKKYIAMKMSQINHQRAIKLLFKIMESEIEKWWD